MTASEGLAVGGEVGDDAVVVLGAAGVGAQAGEHLVEEEDDGAPGGQLPQRAQEGDRAQGGVAALDRFDEDRGDGVAEFVDDVQALLAAVFEDEEFGHRARGDAARDGDGVAAVGAGTAEDRVDVAVVGAAEHDHAVASGGRAGEPQGGGVGLAAGVRERHPLHAGELREQFGGHARVLGARSEAQSVGEVPADGLRHRGGLVAEQQRAEAHGDVGVVVAVDVRQPGAVRRAGRDRVLHLLRRPPEADHGPAVRQHRSVPLRQLLRRAGPLGEAADQVVGVGPLGLTRTGARHAGVGGEGDVGAVVEGRLGGLLGGSLGGLPGGSLGAVPGRRQEFVEPSGDGDGPGDGLGARLRRGAGPHRGHPPTSSRPSASRATASES